MQNFLSSKLFGKIGRYLSVFIIVNILLAFYLGDISISSNLFNFSTKGIVNFLTYNYYINTLIYLIINIIVLICCIGIETIKSKNILKVCYILIALPMLVMFLIKVNETNTEKNKSRNEVYNFIVENDLEGQNICKKNIKNITFSNINRNYETPVICKEESVAYLLSDDLVIKGLKDYMDGNSNSKFNSLSPLAPCRYSCSANEEINFKNNKIIYFLSENATPEQWKDFNESLTKQFKDLHLLEKTVKINHHSQEKTFYNQIALYFITPKILNEKLLVDITPGEGAEFKEIKGYHYLTVNNNDAIILPITKEILEQYKKIKK